MSARLTRPAASWTARGTTSSTWYDRDAGITISVDGVTTFTALAIAPDVSNTGTVEIGKAPTHNYFKGDLDEVALYGGLVPVARIAAHRAAAS